jgi:eukaryotic-like serine/threonine-protein kinase
MQANETPTRHCRPLVDDEVELARTSKISPISGWRRQDGSASGTTLDSSRGLAVGDRLVDCHLVAELGRGASGQVFLAHQESLGDRPIVLKVTYASSRLEQLNLARLQHTNIMPLYWAIALPDEGWQVMAMPYLARTTLARLLVRMEHAPRTKWTGQQVFEVLAADQAVMPHQIAVQAHPAEILCRSSWVEFVARMGHTLAEALAYAHQRELLHLDLKPSNILIAPDGQPILLDLDVARPPIAAGATTVPWLGGTREYMSPEQQAAAAALRIGSPMRLAVDGRSDMYSLGLILYQALGGSSEEGHRPDPLALSRIDPHVSPGLAGIIARCLAKNADERYRDCTALADDLGRHLEDRPLRGVRNRLPDRWRKWRRRRPLGLPMLLLVIGFLVAAGAAGFKFFQRNEDRRRQAEEAFHDGHDWQRKGQYQEASNRFLAGKELAEQTYGAEQLKADLSRSLLHAQRLQKADELNNVVQLLRYYAFQEHPPRRLQWVLESLGRKLWADRQLLIDRSAAPLEVAVEKNIEEQMQELLFLWSELRLRITPPAHIESTRVEVRRILTEAEQLWGSAFGLSLARSQLGEPSGPRPIAKAAWELCAQGRLELDKGNHAEAGRLMQAGLSLEPRGFVPNFYFGVCALRQGDYERAAQALSYCVGLNPSAECFLLRGQAWAAGGETDRALEDFNYALDKNPELSDAYRQRGNLYRDLGRMPDAERDWQRARQLSE